MHLDARPNYARYEIRCGDFCVSFFKQHIINRQERYSFRATCCTNDSTSVSDSRFPRSVQLVARMIHKGNEIKCGDFCVCFFKQRIINRQERYSFRATSCTLRSTISCIKMHSTILAWIQTEATCLTLQGHYDLSRINRVER